MKRIFLAILIGLSLSTAAQTYENGHYVNWTDGAMFSDTIAMPYLSQGDTVFLSISPNDSSIISYNLSVIRDGVNTFSGSYADLTDKPTHFLRNDGDFATGNYNFIGNVVFAGNVSTAPTNITGFYSNSPFIMEPNINVGSAELIMNNVGSADTIGFQAAASSGSVIKQMSLQPYGGGLFYGGNEVATQNDIPTILQNTATLDFPSTPSGEANELTIPLTGAADGDHVDVAAPAGSIAAGNVMYYAYVSSADTVTVKFINNTSGAVDPASGDFSVQIVQQ